MEFMVVNPGFKVEDITPLENILAVADPFVKHPLPPVDKYDLTSYIFASHALEKELYALLDNNLATRVMELAAGMEMPGEVEKKPAYILASAVMGFLIASEFLIDPTMSIYEKAASLGHEAAVDQLFRFRVADHVHPQAWIDLALQRTNRITPDEIEVATDYVIKDAPEIEEKNFGKTLDMWKLNYYSVLKAAALWRKESSDVVAACDYIYWMENESYFNAIAGIFSLVFFSPKRYGKMLKGINSISKTKLLSGLKNAAWDMTYIRYWSKSCKDADENKFWLLCSNDIALRRVASHIFEDPELGEGHLLQTLESYWGQNKAKQILKVYHHAWDRVASDEAARDAVLLPRFQNIDRSIAALEGQLT
jgi:hypothetical protein